MHSYNDIPDHSLRIYPFTEEGKRQQAEIDQVLERVADYQYAYDGNAWEHLGIWRRKDNGGYLFLGDGDEHPRMPFEYATVGELAELYTDDIDLALTLIGNRYLEGEAPMGAPRQRWAFVRERLEMKLGLRDWKPA